MNFKIFLATNTSQNGVMLSFEVKKTKKVFLAVFDIFYKAFVQERKRRNPKSLKSGPKINETNSKALLDPYMPKFAFLEL